MANKPDAYFSRKTEITPTTFYPTRFPAHTAIHLAAAMPDAWTWLSGEAGVAVMSPLIDVQGKTWEMNAGATRHVVE